jgi:hypothetical protein
MNGYEESGIQLDGCRPVLLLVCACGFIIGALLAVGWISRMTADLEVQRERAVAEQAWARVALETEKHEHREQMWMLWTATLAAFLHDRTWFDAGLLAVVLVLVLVQFYERRR